MKTLDLSSAKSFVVHRAPVRAVAFSGDARKLATVDEKGVLVLWSLESFEVIATRQLPSPYSEPSGRALAFLPQGGLLVSHGGGIGVYDDGTLDLVRSGESYNRPTRLQISDGGRSYLGDRNLYDTETFALRGLAIAGGVGEYTGFTVQCAHPATDAIFVCTDGGFEDVGMATEGPLEEKRVSLYGPDLRSERRGRTLQMRHGVYEAAFDPKTRRFVFILDGRLEAWAEDGSSEDVPIASSVAGVLHCFGDASASLVAEPAAPALLRWWRGCFEGSPAEYELPAFARVTLSQRGEWCAWTEIPVNGTFALKVFDLRSLGLPRADFA